MKDLKFVESVCLSLLLVFVNIVSFVSITSVGAASGSSSDEEAVNNDNVVDNKQDEDRRRFTISTFGYDEDENERREENDGSGDNRNSDGRNETLGISSLMDDDVVKLITNPNYYYSYDGYGNNEEHPLWGAKGEGRIRSYPPMNGYVDRIGKPFMPSSLASPSRVTEELFNRMTPASVTNTRNNHRTNPHRLSQLLPYLGEFITRDISVSDMNASDPMPFELYTKPDRYQNNEREGLNNDTSMTGNADLYYCTPSDRQLVQFHRASYKGGTDKQNPRVPISIRSAFLDLGNVYGDDEQTTKSLRTGYGGFMALTKRGLPLRHPETKSFLVADAMTNSNPGLLSLAVIFLRYHNRLAQQFAQLYPLLGDNDEELFQLARMETIAIYQNIVEEKYLPSLLGDTLDSYEGYDSMVNPSIDVFFSTVAFRYGHSAISGNIRVIDRDYQPLSGHDPVLLRDIFFHMEEWVDTLYHITTNTTTTTLSAAVTHDATATVADTTTTMTAKLREDPSYAISGLEPFLRGLSVEPERDVDVSFTPDLAIHTKMVPTFNIQRGRDNGIPSYNQVRQYFGLEQFHNFQQLLGSIGIESDPKLLSILSSLYDNNIDLMDAYVGTLLETEFGFTTNAFVGPTMAKSIKEQFTRIRNGDRFWYKNRYNQIQIDKFPSLSDIVKMVFPPEEMELFPADSFAIASKQDGQDCDDSSSSSAALMSGQYILSWKVNDHTIDVTLTVGENVIGGFIGVGWKRQTMRDATIWFCKVPNMDYEYSCNFTTTTDTTGIPNLADAVPGTATQSTMFSCCVSLGKNHLAPECSSEGDEIFYKLEVIEECLLEDRSSVTIRAPICENATTASNCLDIDKPLDFIASYNPSSHSRPHGSGRRTFGTIDLRDANAGIDIPRVTKNGLFALHGIYMIVCWLFIAPLGIYVVRYCKTSSWRLTVHIAMMAAVESLTFPLIIAAVTLAFGQLLSEHRVTGIALVSLFPVISGLGASRRFLMETEFLALPSWLVPSWLVPSRLGYYIGQIHKYTGWAMLILAWWNCYTGLVRIGPTHSFVQLLTVNTIPLGYNIQIFGDFRQYVFGPWIAFLFVLFLYSEIKERKAAAAFHRETEEKGIWGEADLSGLEIMTTKDFHESTLHGKLFCIIDGYVIDIGDFTDQHPGGKDMLRFSPGTDITQELLGKRPVNGLSHSHSPSAFKLLRQLAIAKMEDTETSLTDNVKTARTQSTKSTIHSRSLKALRSSNSSQDDSSSEETETGHLNLSTTLHPSFCRRENKETIIFETARIEFFQNVTALVKREDKPVIQLFVLVPRASGAGRCIDRNPFVADKVEYSEPLPTGSACLLRVAHGSRGENIIQRYETPVSLKHLQNGDIMYEFFMSMVPGGKLTKALEEMGRGETLFVTKPTVVTPVNEVVHSKMWSFIMLFATGTGLSPILQLIDYLLDTALSKAKVSRTSGVGTFPLLQRNMRIFLVWIVKDPNHNYMEACGLPERIKRSNGVIKWIIIYSSYGNNAIQNSVRGSNRNSTAAFAATKVRSWIGRIRKMKLEDAILPMFARKDTIGQSLELSRNNCADDDSCCSVVTTASSDCQQKKKKKKKRKNNEDCIITVNSLTPIERNEHNEKETTDWWKGGYVTNQRVDYEFIRTLLDSAYSSAHSTSFSSSSSTTEAMRNRVVGISQRTSTMPYYDDVLVAVSGLPLFQMTCWKDLKKVGIKEEHIIRFANTPFRL